MFITARKDLDTQSMNSKSQLPWFGQQFKDSKAGSAMTKVNTSCVRSSEIELDVFQESIIKLKEKVFVASKSLMDVANAVTSEHCATNYL